jgi:hypothetical protein
MKPVVAPKSNASALSLVFQLPPPPDHLPPVSLSPLFPALSPLSVSLFWPPPLSLPRPRVAPCTATPCTRSTPRRAPTSTPRPAPRRPAPCARPCARCRVPKLLRPVQPRDPARPGDPRPCPAAMPRIPDATHADCTATPPGADQRPRPSCARVHSSFCVMNLQCSRFCFPPRSSLLKPTTPLIEFMAVHRFSSLPQRPLSIKVEHPPPLFIPEARSHSPHSLLRSRSPKPRRSRRHRTGARPRSTPSTTPTPPLCSHEPTVKPQLVAGQFASIRRSPCSDRPWNSPDRPPGPRPRHVRALLAEVTPPAVSNLRLDARPSPVRRSSQG